MTTIAIKNVSKETHQKLRLYAAMVDKEHASALDEALTIAINANRKRLIDVFEDTAFDITEPIEKENSNI
tara:strand:- start:27 stop:236 length:210 start_codon:yes stop_codon:yes gene_type:complete